MVLNVTCNKRTDTMVKLCEVFESLNLKIITSNLNSFSGMIFNTVFIEVSISLSLSNLSLVNYYQVVMITISQDVDSKLFKEKKVKGSIHIY